MRYSSNIFESDSYRGTGTPSVSGVKVLTIVLSVISVIGAILLIANFDMVVAKIAIGVAGLLSTMIPFIIGIVGLIILFVKLKWKMYRSFWR